jgi:transposase
VDGRKLAEQLVRHAGGERRALPVIVAPTVEQEDARESFRERVRLVKEKNGLENEIGSLLVKHGCKGRSRLAASFPNEVRKLRSSAGYALPPRLIARLCRAHARWTQVVAQIAEVMQEWRQALQEAGAEYVRQAAQLCQLRGVGQVISFGLTTEIFWRTFQRTAEVGAALGLQPTRYDSGKRLRELGISKAGNKRLRALMIQAAWLWLKYQPDSALSRWFRRRFDQNPKLRRIGIVALARKLVIALWKFVKFGELPEGAALTAG